MLLGTATGLKNLVPDDGETMQTMRSKMQINTVLDAMVAGGSNVPLCAILLYI